ncbi:hypothetical protein [Limimaricola pyoseonensis]|uniref:Sulfotransferase family protein n=1 Tax=Limimaricola pyoseonensis TaxID=521013 RepID=A0A1G6ZGT6_9RHOB|nr:hypothetical protein [Limimaricola pyoseonensis]SDE01819.1 hypothetical protein SAMN04488567_0534 [Limimaricola pyoseonensis]
MCAASSTDVPDRVLVLCTGRCGSTTLARACGHLSNWSAAHESRTHLTGPDRLAYPPRHIECDNRLSWFLGRLARDWGDRAAYVHLTRDPEAVAQSFARRANQGILRAYRQDILAGAARRAPNRPLIDTCRDYVDTVTANIEGFLATRAHVMQMRLETLETDFDRLIDWIGAEGDLTAARAELMTRHNATSETGATP